MPEGTVMSNLKIEWYAKIIQTNGARN